MMKITTPADMDATLAVAIGRFSQACNYLENQLIFILTRLLPITTDMGRAIISGKQMRRNIDVLSALVILPEVPLLDEQRERFKSLIPRLTDINENRSRILHNPIAHGGEDGFLLTVLKSNSVYKIDVAKIDEFTEEARPLWALLFINPIKYDLSRWGMDFSKFQQKDYPTRRSPKQKGPPDEKQKGRPKGAGAKTNHE